MGQVQVLLLLFDGLDAQHHLLHLRVGIDGASPMLPVHWRLQLYLRKHKRFPSVTHRIAAGR